MSSSLLEFSVLYGVHVDPHQPFHVGAPQFKQSRTQEKEDRGNSLVSDMVGLAQSEVYTHIGCSVALKGAAIDVECPFIVVDGPSLVAVEFSTWCCRSVCSSISQGG
jgi:hypothetical protein